MKKKLMLSFLAGSLIVVSASAGAFAASNLQSIKAYLNLGVKLKVNGEPWTAKDSSGKTLYPITYNGATYLPLRAAGEALGVGVSWDGANNTVLIGGSSNAGSSSGSGSNSTTSKYTRSNPAALNTTATIAVDEIINKYTAEIKVNQVLRGDEANQMVADANMFNDPPAEGYEYLVANITFKVVSNAKADAKVRVSPVNFTLVSEQGKDYEVAWAVNPDPSIEAELYAGASHTGWATFIVKKDDKNPLMTYGRKFDGTGGVWFKVQ